MKKLTLAFVFVLLFSAVNGQILYRISGNGLKAPSYLIGTYHLAPATFVDSVPGIAKAMADCKQFYGELDMADMMKPENITKAQQAMMLPEGTTLSSLLNDDEKTRLNAVLREVMGVDLNNPEVAAQFDGLSPTAISTTLTVTVAMQKIPGYNPTALFDNYFQQEALKQGKPVKGFETMDFQLNVLYGDNIEKQVKDLMCMVDNFQDAVDMSDFISAAFFAQDIATLEELFTEEATEGPCASDPESYAILIDNRNADWLNQMPAIMSAVPTFFAVGAGHLVGEKGLLNQLRSMGYNVEGVK